MASWINKRVLCVILTLVLAAGATALGGCSATYQPAVFTKGGVSMVARTSGKYFQVYSNGSWQSHLVKGADIGASVPGHWFGDLATTGSTYSRWFADLAAMNTNTILAYTLLKPVFYQALYDFNRSNPGRKLWLIQGVWPPDQEVLGNLYTDWYVTQYKQEMDLDVKALEGRANIAERTGKAWGKYKVNVMPDVLGVTIGRELLNTEAKETGAANPTKTSLSGDQVQAPAGSRAIEVWCADMAQTLESKLRASGWTAPVGYVSWPTLDPMVHTTEMSTGPGKSKAKEVDDSEVLDPGHILPGPKSDAGIFGVFQIYPYYPEFMYRQPSYAAYRDSQGTLRYGGYLKDFMKYIPDYPGLVGEYGLPTSVSSSHAQPEGLTQGALEEATQGKELARLYRAIVREGYAGGLVFEWADEWAKKNWVTASYMVPFDRHVLWHNSTDPEQCFGILAFDSKDQPASQMKLLWMKANPTGKTGEVQAVYAGANEDFLYLTLNVVGASAMTSHGASGMQLSMGISTLGKDHGTTSLPVAGLPQMSSGVEFLLQLGGSGQSLLLSRPDYNRSNSKFWAAGATDPAFEHTTYVTNRAQIDTATGQVFPTISTDQSVLRYGAFSIKDPRYSSLGNWYIDPVGSRVVVRLPWGLLNVTDPSSNRVIFDESRSLPPGPDGMMNLVTDSLGTVKTPGFTFFAATTSGGSLADFAPRSSSGKSFGHAIGPFAWRGWDQPKYTERFKQSYVDMRALYGSFNSTQVPPAPQ